MCRSLQILFEIKIAGRKNKTDPLENEICLHTFVCRCDGKDRGPFGDSTRFLTVLRKE